MYKMKCYPKSKNKNLSIKGVVNMVLPKMFISQNKLAKFHSSHCLKFCKAQSFIQDSLRSSVFVLNSGIV